MGGRSCCTLSPGWPKLFLSKETKGLSDFPVKLDQGAQADDAHSVPFRGVTVKINQYLWCGVCGIGRGACSRELCGAWWQGLAQRVWNSRDQWGRVLPCSVA